MRPCRGRRKSSLVCIRARPSLLLSPPHSCRALSLYPLFGTYDAPNRYPSTRRPKSPHGGMTTEVQQEIEALGLLLHPHIIHLNEVIETHSHIFLVMKYAKSGELFDYIVEKGRLAEDEAQHFFQQGGIYTLPSHLSSGVRHLISQMLVVGPME